jgi:hypothetical protein
MNELFTTLVHEHGLTPLLAESVRRDLVDAGRLLDRKGQPDVAGAYCDRSEFAAVLDALLLALPGAADKLEDIKLLRAQNEIEAKRQQAARDRVIAERNASQRGSQ